MTPGIRGISGAEPGWLAGGRAVFVLVMSHTAPCRIPGISVAGAGPDAMHLTPPADAEYVALGRCRVMDGIPVTPDGKPTPALMTRAALVAAGIPFVAVSAGSATKPRIPYVETGIEPGGSILDGPAMTAAQFAEAGERGGELGRALSGLADCIILGESVPGGTTTALAVLRGLGCGARVSSSAPENPEALKNRVVEAALARAPGDPAGMAAAAGDPMMPFVAGMMRGAAGRSGVLLAGGTQMAAVLALASRTGGVPDGVALATTTYVADDPSADFADMARGLGVPVLAADPGMSGSRHAGLRAFSEGFAKEGAGAGGAITAYLARTGRGTGGFLADAEAEYERLTSR